MLENWTDTRDSLLRAFPSATCGSHDEVRLTLHGQPVLAWRGVSSRVDSPDVTHLASPILGGSARATDSADAANSEQTAESEPTATPATTEKTDEEAALLARFGIDPSGPDIVELARAAEQLPLGGLRLLGGRVHVHNAVEFPIDDGWLASAAQLIAAEATALGKDGDDAAAGQEGAIDVR